MAQQKHKVYAIPGWGFSSRIFQHTDLTHLSFTPLDYIDVTEISLYSISHYLAKQIRNDAVLIGWSLGGLFAINIAYLFPHKIKKLILIASQPKFVSDGEWIGIQKNNAISFKQLALKKIEALLKKFVALVNYPNKVSAINKILQQSIVKENVNLCPLLDILLHADLRIAYKDIQSPILNIINGSDAVLKQSAACLASLNKNVSIERITKAGHAGFVTHGASYLNVIENFIKK